MPAKRSPGSPRSRSQATGQLDQLASAWLAELNVDRTRAAYRGDLDRFRDWLRANGVTSPLDATTRDVQGFRASLEAAGEATTTMARRMSALRSFYRFACRQGAIGSAPTIAGRTDPAPGAQAGLDVSGVDDVVAAATRLGDRTSALVGLMMFNGLRLDEVLACDLADVTVRPRSVSIVLPRRDGAPSVDVDAWTAAAVRSYLGDRSEGPLLLGESPTRRADRLTRFGADYLIKRAGADAGVAEPISANTLRRTFAAHAHAGGMPLPEIRDRLGHRDVRTTRRHVPDL